ncbi:MAG TPA: S9 family peptidase [Blastocatellia bacterium]|nr:S9 family peptidase [Blastocatellia bacterium]
MQRLRTLTLSALALLVITVTVAAQDKLLTIDDIYDPAKRVNFNGNPPPGLTWLDDTHYLQRKSDPKAGAQLLRVDALTGQSEPFYDAAKMEAAFAKLPGIGANDAKKIAHGPMEMNAGNTAALINYANDLFYYQFGSDTAIRLTNTADEEVGEEFSPDGKMVSYVRSYNIWVVDIATQKERSLTLDGNPKLFNGRLDWVYQEEVYGRGNFKGYWWSPDSTRITYLQLDESQVKDFTITDHIPNQQDLEVYAYPKSGMPNPAARLAVVNVAGGASKWVDTFKYQQVEPLIVRVGWKPDSSRVWYCITNREQNWIDLNFADPATGKSETAFRDGEARWIESDNLIEPYWLKGGSFIWVSERTGWKHLYLYSTDCKLVRPITSGKWEAQRLHGVDEANGWVYFSGTERSHIGSDTYRIKLDGTGLQRLTEAAGTHNANFNPSFTHFIDAWSDAVTPTQVKLHTADGKLARVIDENRVEALKAYKLSKPEFVQVKTRDGFVMEAMMIKPPDFDPKKRYPVFEHTYSGPHAPQVRNVWGIGMGNMWHQMLAQKGYIIWVCDNRSASGKGAESTWPIFHNLGELELRDLEDGLAWLKQQPYVDGSRIALNGWSYGGYMTSYALTHSTAWKVGIVGAPVTDWHLYDTIYTERYMGTPQNNPEGYEKSSVTRAAKNLSGKMLLIHGTIDDNVHMQNSIQFIYELEKAGKPFELMVYPKSRHGFSDPRLIKHMRELMLKFIQENL